MKKLCALISAALAAVLCLSGCSIFETEYVSVEDYVPTVQNESSEKDMIIVHNIAQLQQTIRTIIASGETEGMILFASAYDGDPTEDMPKACWQVRTQDALCAYCVENISYELTKIVTYYEARLTISYSDFVKNSEEIVHLPYAAGIELLIKEALSAGSTKLVILVDHSMYSDEDIESMVLDVYRKNPASVPKEPLITVNMYSGSSMQRLYEINLRYGLSAELLALRKAELEKFAPFTDEAYSELDEAKRALIAYEYIVENCELDIIGMNNTAYDALIKGKADSEGVALAFVELCRQLGVECQIVYGQHDWQEHCWNIVCIDDYYCHVDAGLVDNRTVENCFMKSDESFWGSYRWDMSSYPACSAQSAAEEHEPLKEEEIELEEFEEEFEALLEEEGAGVPDMQHEPGEEEVLIIEILEEN